MFESEEFPGSMETDVAAFIDPRTVLQGVRIHCVAESFQADNVTILQDPDQEYKIARMVHGILEGGSEIGNNFPLNVNLNTLNGVSFDKGCYIGQELT